MCALRQRLHLEERRELCVCVYAHVICTCMCALSGSASTWKSDESTPTSGAVSDISSGRCPGRCPGAARCVRSVLVVPTTTCPLLLLLSARLAMMSMPCSRDSTRLRNSMRLAAARGGWIRTLSQPSIISSTPPMVAATARLMPGSDSSSCAPPKMRRGSSGAGDASRM